MRDWPYPRRGVLIALLLGGLALALVARAMESQTHLRMVLAQRDSLMLMTLEASATAMRWEAAFATVVPELSREIGVLSPALDSLAREVEAAELRIASLTRAVAHANNRLVDTVEVPVGSIEGLEGSWQGHVSDGLLEGFWSFSTPPPVWSLDYSVAVPFDIATVQTGSQVLVLARSPDDRVRLAFDTTLVSLPPPLRVERCPWKCSLWRVLTGALLWELVR
jgi:hypothetical protein